MAASANNASTVARIGEPALHRVLMTAMWAARMPGTTMPAMARNTSIGAAPRTTRGPSRAMAMTGAGSDTNAWKSARP